MEFSRGLDGIGGELFDRSWTESKIERAERDVSLLFKETSRISSRALKMARRERREGDGGEVKEGAVFPSLRESLPN